jgi:hydrogenase expression/formation protein HypD
MKYLDEFRDPEIVKSYLDKIHKVVSRPWAVMEICGGQTHSLVKNGIIDLLPEEITMVHGPGLPGMCDACFDYRQSHRYCKY